MRGRAPHLTFDNIAAFDVTLVNIPAGEHFERVMVGKVSARLFSLFGARTQVGRPFSTTEDAPGGNKVAVASDAFWTRRFQRGSAIGRTLQLNGESYTIVGILEPTFDAAIITNLHDTGPDVYVPLPDRSREHGSRRQPLRRRPRSPVGVARRSTVASCRCGRRPQAYRSPTTFARVTARPSRRTRPCSDAAIAARCSS